MLPCRPSRHLRPAVVGVRGLLTTLAALGLGAVGCSRAERSPRPPNVVLVSVDTLRADKLNSYGYTARRTSPHMDELAEDGLLFEVHVAASPWTTPSHLSLLTGLTPTRHGVVGTYGALMAGLSGSARVERLAEAVSTLAEVLAAHGWVTGAFTGGATVDPRIGFGQGFEDYDTSMVKLDDASVGRLLGWIDAREGAPFFLFWHTFEVHAPYLDGRFLPDVLPAGHARELQERLARLPAAPDSTSVSRATRILKRHNVFREDVVEALYDGGVRSFDRRLGELVKGLRRRGLYERTMIVLTSDHGEQLGEPGRPETPWGRGFYNVHGHTVYEELIRVPLILKLPGEGLRGRRFEDVTASIDVMPTILDVLGLPVPAEVQGRTLRGLWENAVRTPREALSEALAAGDEAKSLRGERYKYVVTVDAATVESRGRSFVPAGVTGSLFDLHLDPGEERNLLSGPSQPEQVRRAFLMAAELRRRVEVVGRPEMVTLSDEALKSLRALGYLE